MTVRAPADTIFTDSCLLPVQSLQMTPPPPGETIVGPDRGEPKAVGRVLTAERDPGGGAQALVVMSISDAGRPGLRLGSAQGARVESRPVPYALPTR